MTERLREFMTLIPCTIERTQSLRHADALMEEFALRHLPVVDSDGLLVGILSQREVQALMHARGIEPDRTRVDEVACRTPYAASPESALEEVCATMAKRHYGCVVAVQGGRPLGIFTTTDACAKLASMLQERRVT